MCLHFVLLAARESLMARAHPISHTLFAFCGYLKAPDGLAARIESKGSTLHHSKTLRMLCRLCCNISDDRLVTLAMPQ